MIRREDVVPAVVGVLTAMWLLAVVSVVVGLAALLVGCSPGGLPADPVFEEEKGHVLAGWADALGPATPACTDEIAVLQVEQVRDDDPRCPAGWWGCHPDRAVVLVRDGAWGWRRSLVRGQILHVLAWCELGDPDDGRDDPRLWLPPGNLDAVIVRAAVHAGATDPRP